MPTGITIVQEIRQNQQIIIKGFHPSTICLLPSNSDNIHARKDIRTMKDWVFAIWIILSLLLLIFAYIQYVRSEKVSPFKSPRFRRLFVKVIILLGLIVYMLIRS